MERASDNRSTYIATAQYDLEQVLQEIESIKLKEPTCQRVLAALERNDKLLEAPQLTEIFLTNSRELIKLMQTCLQPEALECRKCSWPLLSRNLLMQQPPVLLEEALKHTDTGRYLFAFLRHQPNDTARGYFSELLHFTDNNFQDKLLSFLIMDKESLHLCLSCCYYPEVFSFLFQTVVYCGEEHKEFATLVMRALLDRIDETKHCCELAENLLSTMQRNHRNYYKLLDGKLETPESQQLQKFCLKIFNIVQQCWTGEYNDKLVNLCLESWHKDQQLAEVLLQILSEEVRVFTYIPHLAKKLGLPENNPIRDCVIGILRKMPELTDILKEQPQRTIRDSTGEEIRCVGMLRYRMLELLEVVLHLDPNLVNENYDLHKNGVLKLLQVLLVEMQRYITMNPWNNQVHLLVEGCLINLINSFDCYSELEDNYIGTEGFLAFLIETFRNHEFIFLASCNTNNYGYIHSLYNIAKAVIIKLDQSKSLKAVMSRFQPWQDFIIKDLQKYEATMDIDLGGQPIKTLSEKKKNMGESIRRIVVDLTRKEVSEVSEGIDDISDDHFIQIDYFAGWPGTKRPQRNQQRRFTVGSEAPRFEETSFEIMRANKQLKKTSSQTSQPHHSFSEIKDAQDLGPVIVEHKILSRGKDSETNKLDVIPEEDAIVEVILNFALDKKQSTPLPIESSSEPTDNSVKEIAGTHLRRGLSERATKPGEHEEH